MKRKEMMPTTYLLVAIIAMAALHFLLPVKKMVPSPWKYAGGLLVLVGSVGNVWCSNVFDKVKTTVKPFEQSSCLVTNGLYRFSRHPMYLGMALILLGLAVLLGSVTPILVIPVFVWVMTKRFIEIEEKALEETFGDAYLEYEKRVRRWI